jgi:hypothetical protein
MTIDYYLSMSAAIAGIITNSPILKAVPTALHLTATGFPRLFPLGILKRLTSEENEKLGKIKNLLPEICQNLGIKDSTKINLRVSKQMGANACMVGSTHSFGGPLLCLGDTFFSKYEPLLNPDDNDFREWLALLEKIPAEADGLDKYIQSCTEETQARIRELSGKFESLSIIKDPEFREWLSLLNEMPNTPLDLGKYLDSCSGEKRERIKNLATKFRHILSQDEIKSIFAHELGHAKNHHTLKTFGFLSIILTADKLTQVFANSLGFGNKYSLASIALVSLSIYAVSRSHETEADGECAAASQYQKGMLKFHKKELINHLFQKTSSSFESKTSEMLKGNSWLSSHPNAAKRMEHAAQLLQTEHPSASVMTVAAKALVGLGALSLIRKCLSHAVDIWNVSII